MSKNNKYRYFIAAAAVLVAVVLVILFVTGKLDGLLNELETGSSVGESSSVSESLGGSSGESISEESSVPRSSITSETSSSLSASSSAPKSSSSSSSTAQRSSSLSAPQSSGSPIQSPLKFRNKNLLNQHYQKHGIDMGFSSAAEYEKAAAQVPYAPDVLHKIEKEDGDDIYYIESTNEFVVVSTDGYIRTYFNPDRGIDYFNRQ